MCISKFPLLVLVAGAIAAVIAFSGGNSQALNSSDKTQLRLTTSILKERYCSDSGTTFLYLTLKLEYTNRGNESILLDKKSSRIARTMVSRSLKDAAKGRYLYAPVPFYSDLGPLGFQSTPDEVSFIVLSPSESYTVEASCRMSVDDGTDQTKDDLHTGHYMLQIRVPTWHYYADPTVYRDKWVGKGYLWADNVTSEPMPIAVQKQRSASPCSQ